MTSLELARVALGLKEVRRSGWVREGHPDAESVADHSWSVSLLALLLCPPELNREKLLIMAILHDLAEVRIGDITPQDGIPPGEKHAREDAAMADLLADHPDLLETWREAEARQTPEARFLKGLDGLEMGLQADRYVGAGALSEIVAAQFRKSAGELYRTLGVLR